MKVQVILATTTVQYPAITTTTGTVISLVVPAGAAAIPSQTVAPGVVDAEFDNVPDGVGYTVTAQLLDGAGAPLGVMAVSAAFDVVTPVTTVGIATPTAITVHVV